MASRPRLRCRPAGGGRSGLRVPAGGLRDAWQARRDQNIGPLAALAVGGYIVLAGLWASPVSGAAMNPARSLAPDLVRGNMSGLWPYLLGPLVGALLAVACAHILRGPGSDPDARKAAQGTLG